MPQGAGQAARFTRGQNHVVILRNWQRIKKRGIAAIWLLHLSAAKAYRDGHKLAAAGIIEIAEAAEQEWLRRGETRVLNRWPHWRA